LLLGVALALRLGWALTRPAMMDPTLGDQFEYFQLATNLLHTGEYRFEDARFGDSVYAYRTPGYPLFVAACGANLRAVRVAQALVDTSTVLAIYLFTRRFFGGRAALIAAGIVALNPFLVYFTGLILSETLFTALLAWGILLSVNHSRAGHFSGMVVLALVVLVRPSVLGLVPLLVGMGAVLRRCPSVSNGSFENRERHLSAALPPAKAGSPKGHHPLLDALLAIILIGAVLLPWAYRNARHPALQKWIWTTTNNGITLYDGFHNQATGASDQKGFLEALKPELRGLSELERDRFFAERARRWIVEHPGRSLDLGLAKIGRTWSPIPLSSEYGSRAYVAIGLIYTVPVYLLFFIGLFRGGGGKTLKALCLLPAIYFTGIHAASVGSLRYRVPCEPPMAVIAGAGAAMLLNVRRSARPGTV